MVNGQFLYLWEERDSNPRTLMGADLQSAAIATMRSSQKLLTHYLCLGDQWGSNPRHSEPQSDALPTELWSPYFERHGRIELPSPAWQAGIITTIRIPQKILQLHHKGIWSRVVELDHSNWFCRPGPNRSANPTLLLLPCKWINFIKKFWIIFFYIPSYISFKFNTIIIKIFFNFFNPSK